MDDITNGGRNVSILVLKPRTISRISNSLNTVMIIPTDHGILRYWRGLAGLCEISPDYVDSIAQDSDPTKKVLNLWYEKSQQRSTIHQFLLFLEEMDRHDVINDVIELIDEDIDVFKSNPSEIKPPSLDLDKYIITTEDIAKINQGQALEIYDAFVLYDEDDLEFAIELIKNMEEGYSMRLCVKNRDFVGGGFELDKMVKVITERCKRVIVILSDSFFASSANHYYLSFAHTYGLECERKIIPCMYKECTLPPEMKCLFILDYRRMAVFNFWDKLRDSLSVAYGDKFKVDRSLSHNNQTLKSVLRENYPTGFKSSPGVRFSSSANDLNNLVDLPPTPLNPSASADYLGPFPASIKKEKKNWRKFLQIGPLKKERPKIKNDAVDTEKRKRISFNKHIKRKAVPIAN